MQVPEIDRIIGIEAYASRTNGIGGVIRRGPEEFVVEEVLVDGSKARVDGTVQNQVLGSSWMRNRYLLCVLVKRNWDLLIAIKTIARQLGIGSHRINVCGMKDARAVTAQHLTFRDVEAGDVERVRCKDIELHPIGYLRHELSPFYLLGNSFRITVGDLNLSEETTRSQINETLTQLQVEGGTPNLFGHQRFGSKRPITHLVGNALVKGDLKEAVMIFLAKPSPNEHEESRHAREELEKSQDFQRALVNFPKNLRYERLMLHHLSEKSEDYAEAFRKLPVKLCRLFVQGFQSYLFNRFLSSRMKNGLSLTKAYDGDYVVNIEKSGLPMPATVKTVSPNTITEINQLIDDGRMKLAIPLVGFKQETSKGVQGEIERAILQEENVSLEDFRVIAMPELGLRGEPRTATAPLKQFSYSMNPCDRDDGSAKLSIKIAFTLYRGSYATIVLRELMKPPNPIPAGF